MGLIKVKVLPPANLHSHWPASDRGPALVEGDPSFKGILNKGPCTCQFSDETGIGETMCRLFVNPHKVAPQWPPSNNAETL